jgi:hypothetical protein
MHSHYYELPMRIFAAHVGMGPAVPGYAARPWREWLLCSGSLTGCWFAVRKDAPLAKPRAFPMCSLAQAKATLKAT